MGKRKLYEIEVPEELPDLPEDAPEHLVDSFIDCVEAWSDWQLAEDPIRAADRFSEFKFARRGLEEQLYHHLIAEQAAALMQRILTRAEEINQRWRESSDQVDNQK